MKYDKMKGVTPVVATVLLLGITVLLGGMLVTVAQGYFNDLGSGVDTTDMAIQSVYEKSSSDELTLSIANTGDTAFNTSNYRVFIDDIPFTTDSGANGCFNVGDSDVIDPGDIYNCKLDRQLPGALESIEISIRDKDSERTWEYTCQPKTSSDKSC
jgi:flagellin-like protein